MPTGTRYQIPFYLSWMEPVLKLCNIPKDYGLDCMEIVPSSESHVH